MRSLEQLCYNLRRAWNDSEWVEDLMCLVMCLAFLATIAVGLAILP